MKIVISPAKSLDFSTPAPTSLYTQPIFLEEAQKIIQNLKQLSPKELSELMHISTNLAALNYERNQKWQPPFTPKNAKQAIFAFTGDVYRGLDIQSLDLEKLPVLQEKLRILSGLYGLLRPLDLIQPYRLEMGTKLSIDSYKNLYQFWGDKVVNALNNEMNENDYLVNLASNEYFKALPKKLIKPTVITPIFKDYKNGQYKTIAIFAKKARGLMSRFIIENNINTPDELKEFNKNNYRYTDNLSTETNLVFTR